MNPDGSIPIKADIQHIDLNIWSYDYLKNFQLKNSHGCQVVPQMVLDNTSWVAKTMASEYEHENMFKVQGILSHYI